MEEGNYITNSLYRTGLYSGPLQKDPQYELYEELKATASDQEIQDLILAENAAVRYYAILIFLSRSPSEAIQFVFENEKGLKSKSVAKFLNYCQGTIDQKLIDALHFRIYDMILDEEINLSAKSLVRFLQLRERRFVEASEERLMNEGRGF
ncbi:MAG: hypothetical protein AAF741_10735 [Bacteroidota bacterium]